jgi:hypothetical protein
MTSKTQGEERRKVKPVFCFKCKTMGYPICRFCHPKRFRKWYLKYFRKEYDQESWVKQKMKSQKIHFVRWRTYAGFNPQGKKVRFKRLLYLCNGACGITPSKSTRNPEDVTCKNCLKLIKKW